MKKLVSFVSILAVFTVVAVTLLLVKQYYMLCLMGYDAIVAAPGYFTDAIITALPSLF